VSEVEAEDRKDGNLPPIKPLTLRGGLTEEGAGVNEAPKHAEIGMQNIIILQRSTQLPLVLELRVLLPRIY
jgi:hypothetical protein